MSRSTRETLLACILATALTGAGGCDRTPTDLAFADLTAAEARYVERIVVLERAKAVALVARPAGNALLDSLAAAWGDSSLSETETGLTEDPHRAALVGRLLVRILEADEDSLVHAPRADRLAAPMPEPAVTPPPTRPAR